jgi:hypothetical protein
VYELAYSSLQCRVAEEEVILSADKLVGTEHSGSDVFFRLVFNTVFIPLLKLTFAMVFVQ